MANITLELDLPEGVTVESYQRHEDAHAFEVALPFLGATRPKQYLQVLHKLAEALDAVADRLPS